MSVDPNSARPPQAPGPQDPGATPPRPAIRRTIRPELLNWQVLEEESRRAYFARGAPSARAAHGPPAAPVPRGEGAGGAGAISEDAVSETTVSATVEREAIDGEAYHIEDPAAAPVTPIAALLAAPPDAAADQTTDTAAHADQVDSILIAALPERRVVVQPGSKATLVVSLLNNGPQAAQFEVHLEGWVQEAWLPEPTPPVLLRPGARAAVTITLAPPRRAATTAGEFPIFVVVRSPQHLRRSTRLAATLVILPFSDFAVGRLLPGAAALGTLRRRALFSLPVSNLGNHPITLNVQGQAAGLPCTFSLQRAGATGTGVASGWQPDPVLLDLAPDESADLLVRVAIGRAPLFATRPIAVPLRLVVSIVANGSARDTVRPPRVAAGDLTYSAPIKIWHLAAAGLASLLLLATMGLLALGARLLLDFSRAAPNPAPAAPAASAPVVIVLNQAPPVSSGAASASAPPAAQPTQATAAPAAHSASGALLVDPSMVTRPGEAAPVAQGGPRSAAPAAAASNAAQPLTYAEMFQEIALRYDLDWRLLAAQAYVESGFDTLALGQDGDMGLMQVLPATWREWGPGLGVKDPFDAYSNTLVAAAYLDHIRALLGKRGLPQAQWMLVGYNWGPDRLSQFLDGGGVWEQLPAVRAQYAADILRIARTIP